MGGGAIIEPKKTKNNHPFFRPMVEQNRKENKKENHPFWGAHNGIKKKARGNQKPKPSNFGGPCLKPKGNQPALAKRRPKGKHGGPLILTTNLPWSLFARTARLWFPKTIQVADSEATNGWSILGVPFSGLVERETKGKSPYRCLFVGVCEKTHLSLNQMPGPQKWLDMGHRHNP